MDEFEKLLSEVSSGVERFVRYRLPSQADAEDVLQEVYFSAYRKFPQLKNPDAFQPWILSIARNKCSDYFRAKAARMEISIEELARQELSNGRLGISVVHTVRETLDRLGDKDKQILYLYFWKELPQAEIAKLLDIPVGTVKSRLFTAKQHFKDTYPYPPRKPKGEPAMQKLPEYIPDYTIVPSTEPPFSVKWEELMGWFLVPKLGEKLSWAMYDIPSRKCSHVYDMAVTARAKVHGIEGVEITARESPASKGEEAIHRTFVAQLTDTHCRYLAALRTDGGVRNYITFLDGDDFMAIWGFGENNCGNETYISPRGQIRRKGDTVTSENRDFLLDIVGRYTIRIGGKSYDTVCLMNIETFDCGTVSEQFLDQDGRTILWRRFNRDDWAIDRFGGKPWSELLPDNDRLTINGKTYVHWYDCITDYIL